MSAFYGSFSLSLTLKAPFLIAGTEPMEYGVDIAQIRNHQGQAVIPDSHIKGVLRHAWEYRKGGNTGLATDTLFGEKSVSIENSGGQIWFTDLVAENQPVGADSITRLAIDPDTGAANPGSLFVIEAIAKPGTEVCFRGEVTIRTATKAEAQGILAEIETALSFVSSIGKFKTVGFGRLIESKVGNLVAIPRQPARTYTAGKYDLAFEVNKPLLVDTTRPDGNMFSGSQIINGGTIKGALAAKLRADGLDPEDGDLGSALSMMTISHAFPDVPNLRELPLDLVEQFDATTGKGVIRKIDETNIDFADEATIPKYAPDFKVNTGREYLEREFRTHVAIDPKTGGAAESKLFSTSGVLHVQRTIPTIWRATISLPDYATPGQKYEFNRCMNEISHGLFTLGKSKARTLNTKISAAVATPAKNGPEEWRVVLDTPLLMLREYHLSTEALYWAAIGEYWSQATNGCYRLKYVDDLPEIYAQQTYSSGYQPLMFAFFGADWVEPFVLCKPGSVFVLDCIDTAKAPAERARLEQSGLPAAKWTLPGPSNRLGDNPGDIQVLDQPNFALCPFGQQNGFGQIRAEGVT